MRLFNNTSVSIVLYGSCEPSIHINAGKASLDEVRLRYNEGDTLAFHDFHGATLACIVHKNDYNGHALWLTLITDLPEGDDDASSALAELVKTCGEYWPKEESEDETTEEEKGE